MTMAPTKRLRPPAPPAASTPNARLTNLSTKQSLTLRLERADDMFARARGLMFRKEPANILFTFDYAARHGIHSFFVANPFDALYLDAGWVAVDVMHRVAPFQPYLEPRGEARYLIELAPGLAERLGVKIGDRLEVRWL